MQDYVRVSELASVGHHSRPPAVCRYQHKIEVLRLNRPIRQSKRMTSPNILLSAINNIHPRNWSIRQKISISFGGLILLMTAGMGITLLKLDSVKRTAASALEERQPAANYFQHLSQNLNQAVALLNSYLLTKEIEHKTRFKQVADDIADRLDGARQQDIFQNLEVDDTLHTSQALLRQYREHAKKLFALHDNGLNNRGLLLAGETLNPLAIRFLGNINTLLDSDDIEPGDPQVAQTLLILQKLRYNWVRMMGALNLYITAQNKDILINFNNFKEHINVLMEKLNQQEVNIGFGEIEEMSEIHADYLASLSPVLEIFETDAWRADTHLLRTRVQPVTDQLQTLFEGTADKLLNAAFNNSQELTHELYQIRIFAITGMALALLTGILLAFRFTHGIVPPIQRLMSAANQVAKGDLNAEVMVTSRDEIGQLSSLFNIMVNHLRQAAMTEQQMLHELQTLNQDLENRVNERTRDLEESEIKIRAVLDNIGEGILVLDESGTIESLNPAAMTIFALESNEAIGLHSTLLAGGYDVDKFAESEQQSDNQQPKECLGLRADGNTFPMEIVVSGMLIGHKRMRACIVRDITARKETEQTLADAQNQLVDAAHKSGMADMATGVLHNIGNILNSVNLASEEIHRISNNSKITGLLKAGDMLLKNDDNIDDFLTQDARGKKLPEYFIKIGKVLNIEISDIQKESKELIAKTTMMKEVISTQQTYARSGFHNEQLNLPELVEDALKIQDAALKKWGVKLNTQFSNTPACIGQKSKLLQVITNLIKNAKEAMGDNDQFNKPKEMLIETGMANNNTVYLKIKDNGCGINEKQLTKIFNHGFTTKKTGHGFGLHTCANAMTEMKGSLNVDSEGVQKGACFTVKLPRKKAY